MANTAPIYYGTPTTKGTNFVNGDGTAKKTIYTAGALGARVLSVQAVTSDTGAAGNDVNMYVQVGATGTAYNIGGVNVPPSSGDAVVSTAPSVLLSDPTQIVGILPDGSIQLGAGDALQAAPVAAVSTGTLTIFVQAGDY